MRFEHQPEKQDSYFGRLHLWLLADIFLGQKAIRIRISKRTVSAKRNSRDVETSPGLMFLFAASEAKSSVRTIFHGFGRLMQAGRNRMVKSGVGLIWGSWKTRANVPLFLSFET